MFAALTPKIVGVTYVWIDTNNLMTDVDTVFNSRYKWSYTEYDGQNDCGGTKGYYDLRDIRSFKVLRENDIIQRPNGVIPTKGIKNLKIYLKYQEGDKDYFTLNLEPDINGPIPFYMQKNNAFHFICKLNELLLSDN